MMILKRVYKIHIIYGALAAPSEKAYATVNDSPEAITFSWEVSTTPVEVEGFKPTASVVIDSTKISADALKNLENYLYGTDDAEAAIPLPDKIVELVSSNSTSESTDTTTTTDTDAQG